MIVDENEINKIIAEATAPSAARLQEIIGKALEKKGLELFEAAELLAVTGQEGLQKMFAASSRVKKEIYGDRLVLFAPLYLSSYCVNDCAYCGFHASNPAPRKKLSMQEIREQVLALLEMGHKRLLVEAGEHPENSIDYVVDAIKTIYSVRHNANNIRRVNVNIAATTTENYRKLKEAGIGTYQLFQETYHHETYKKLHKGPKADYDRQLTAHKRAFEAGIDDLGIGVLFGLYDFRFEVLALIQHAQWMDSRLGVGPHTISVPRWRPAPTVNIPLPHQVSDSDFLKIISVLRLAVPYTGMILSTREGPEMREKAFRIGISQTSAASRTSPGGYTEKHAEQFEVSDHRSVDEVVQGMCRFGFLPSFCTACYRSGRTGDDFMPLAKSGRIQLLCQPNALLTFKEYLLDYASPETKRLGEELIAREAQKIPDAARREEFWRRIKRLENGERDLFF